MEDHRVDVTPEVIADYLQNAIALIDDLPAHLLFNADEMGHQEWADRHERTCFVPVFHQGDQVGYPVSRAGKRITLLAYIATDGSHTKPLVIVPWKTLDANFRLRGLTSEKVQIASQSKSYIDIRIFEKLLVEIFTPALKRRREIYGYGGTAVLILDNCTSHGPERVHLLCAENNLVPLFLPPHSSNQLQPLDFSVFSLTKRLFIRVHRMEKLNFQT
jgi:hypothetical protein